MKALLALLLIAAFLLLYLRREERMEPDEYESWRFV